MQTETIPTRVHLVDLLPPGSVVIELGVAAGEFAAQMLDRNDSIRYTGVDRWNDHHNIAEREAAIDRIQMVGKHAPQSILHTTFSEARKIIKYQADMIYIDGYAHTGQERGETLRDWWPVLKPGGVYSGHDYDAREYPQTVEAVDAFVHEHRLELHLTGEESLPSWWVRKPLTGDSESG